MQPPVQLFGATLPGNVDLLSRSGDAQPSLLPQSVIFRKRLLVMCDSCSSDSLLLLGMSHPGRRPSLLLSAPHQKKRRKRKGQINVVSGFTGCIWQ